MQKYQITWTYEALSDFEYYVDWYLNKASTKVATDFINSIEKAIHLITENPLIARPAPEIPEAREYVVQKYPYLISYSIKNNQIIILAFLHQKQKH